MKIGEFAELCGTKISVLRHYDSQGLLKPDYVDSFTGYRYYSAKQAEVFRRIYALKMAGFSLAEIRGLIRDMESGESIERFFENKRLELEHTLHNLEQAMRYLKGTDTMENNKITFTHQDSRSTAVGAFGDDLEAMDRELAEQDYQRISVYTRNGDDLVCEVIKLNKESEPLHEDEEFPFVDDADVIGKWEIVGEYCVKQDFYDGMKGKEKSLFETKDIYFLPDGESYWCFGWTKGRLIIDTGYERALNDYETEESGGQRYMFISLKSYSYRRGGMPTVLVLRQVDTKRYSARELARKDDIDKPFAPDERVLSKWNAFDFTADKENWLPENKTEMPLYFESVEFLSGGSCVSVYGGEIISGDDMQVWTNGYILRKWNSTACAYEIREIGGTEYLIIEWKSGDYRWGGFDTNYYVFVRA